MLIYLLRASRARRLTASLGLSLTAATVAAATLTATLFTPLSALARPIRRSASKSAPRVHRAMVRVETARLRSGPGEEHKPSALLDAGRAASVIARNGDWAKLRLESGREGWVRADLLAISKKTVKVARANPDSDTDEPTKPPRQKRSRNSETPAKVAAAKPRHKKATATVVATRPAPHKAHSLHAVSD